MVSTRELQPFDVVVASVAFEDNPAVAKPRPAIVLSCDDDVCVVTAVKVTSHAPRAWCAGEVELLDWEDEGLLRPSCARCSKIVRLHQDDIKCRIGALSSLDRARVLESML